MNNLLSVEPSSWIYLIISSIIVEIIIWLIISFWRNIEIDNSVKNKFWKIIRGGGLKVEDDSKIAADNWLGFIIGILKVNIYSICFASNNVLYIGGMVSV